MLIVLDSHQMKSLDGNGLIKLACDKLSSYGIKNFIHWGDLISVSIGSEELKPMVDYAAGGVRFLKSSSTTSKNKEAK